MAAHSPPSLASNNEIVRELVDLRCRTLSYEADLTLARDFESLQNEVKKRVMPELVDLILDMAEKFRLHCLLFRECDRKNPVVYVYNMVHGTLGHAASMKEKGNAIYEGRLKPFLGEHGEPSAEAILNTVMAAAWHEQNCLDWDLSQGGYLTGTAKGYLEASWKNKLWEDYWAQRMGLDKSRNPALRNVHTVIKKLVVAECRKWTTENNADNGLYPKGARSAALEIAEREASEASLNPAFMEAVQQLAQKWRLSAHYSRLRGAGSDGCVTAEHEARRILDEKVRPLASIHASTLWEVCRHSAWYEQNHVDADRSASATESSAYTRVALRDKSNLDKAIHQLDLSGCPEVFVAGAPGSPGFQCGAPMPDEVPFPQGLFAPPRGGEDGFSATGTGAWRRLCRRCCCFPCARKRVPTGNGHVPEATIAGARSASVGLDVKNLELSGKKPAQRARCACFSFMRSR